MKLLLPYSVGNTQKIRQLNKLVRISNYGIMLELETITIIEISIRISLAALAGLILGLDRDIKGKPVDFRAYMIICMAAAMIAILSQELLAQIPQNADHQQLDTFRIIEGVLVGIGFLGAGAIIKNDSDRSGREVIGTATGASIWASGGIGLTLGFGFYVLAGLFLSGFYLPCYYSAG